MFNKITKNLIIFGVIVFSFAVANAASAVYYSDGFTGYPRTGFYNRATPSDSYTEDQEYSRYEYDEQGGYNYPSSSSSNTQASAKPTVINNYYYSTAPKTSTTSTTSTTSNTSNGTVKENTVAQNSAGKYSNVPAANVVAMRSNGSANYLGASAYDGSTFAASAGSSRSDGFMPNTIGEWILAIILILVIVIISRVIARKAKEDKATAKTS